MMYNVRYKQYLITDNTIIRRTGFGAISFENIGADNAMINNVIPLDNTGIARSFSEKPYCRIESDFTVTFAGNDPDKRVLVVETYYTEAK